MFGFLRRMFHDGGFGTLWCSFLHDSPMWPIRGHYECRTCGRQYRVPWAEPERTGAAAHPANAASIARIRAGAGAAVDGGVGHAVTARAEYRVGVLRDGSGSAGAFRRQPDRRRPVASGGDAPSTRRRSLSEPWSGAQDSEAMHMQQLTRQTNTLSSGLRWSTIDCTAPNSGQRVTTRKPCSQPFVPH